LQVEKGREMLNQVQNDRIGFAIYAFLPLDRSMNIYYIIDR